MALAYLIFLSNISFTLNCTLCLPYTAGDYNELTLQQKLNENMASFCFLKFRNTNTVQWKSIIYYEFSPIKIATSQH